MCKSPCITKSLDRLERARDAITALDAAENFGDAERAWSEFLTAAANIYSKLEQGSKISGEASAWFGRVKKERKDDALLSYIHHARNSDEHSIDDITEVAAKTFEMIGPVEVMGNTKSYQVRAHDRPSLQLVTVRDRRYNDEFDPPGWHIEKCIIDYSPSGIAKLAFDYLSALIVGAEEMGI